MASREYHIGLNGRIWKGTRLIPQGTYHTLTAVCQDQTPTALVLTNIRGATETFDPQRTLLHIEYKAGNPAQDRLLRKDELKSGNWRTWRCGRMIPGSLKNCVYRDIYPFRSFAKSNEDPKGSDPLIVIPASRLKISRGLCGTVYDTKRPYYRYYGHTLAIPKNPQLLIDDPDVKALYFVCKNPTGERVITRLLYGMPFDQTPYGKKYIYQQEGKIYTETNTTHTGPT